MVFVSNRAAGVTIFFFGLITVGTRMGGNLLELVLGVCLMVLGALIVVWSMKARDTEDDEEDE